MIKISEVESKVNPARKIIKLNDIQVKDLKFVDETGDITDQVIEAIPSSVDTVSFRITVELPDDYVSEDGSSDEE